MTQQAAKQAYLSVSTAEAAADTITGISAANPGVVTAASHGIADGAIVRITGVLGMLQVNNRALVVDNPAANTFELKGEDTSVHTPYASGGQAFAQTMTEVSYCRVLGPGFNGEAPDVDVSHLRSLENETLLGMNDPGTLDLQLWYPSVVDTSHARLRALKRSGAAAAFSITLASGQIAAFMASVKSFTLEPLNKDGAVGGTCSLRLRAGESWFA